jgi:hypothetical protein
MKFYMEVFMKKVPSALAELSPGAMRFQGRQKRGFPQALALGVVLVLFGRCDLPYSPPPVEQPDIENPGEDAAGKDREDEKIPETGKDEESGKTLETGKDEEGGKTPETGKDEEGGKIPEAGKDGESGKTPETGKDEENPGTGGEPVDGDDPAEGPGEGDPDAPPEEPVLSAIEISDPPDKVVYAKGEALDLRGLRVTGLYTGGSSRPEGLETLQFSGYDPARSGEQCVVVSLEGKTAEFTVRVSLSELELSLSLPVEGELSVEGLPPGDLALSRSGAKGLSQELRFSAAGYEQLFCFVNGRSLVPVEAAEGDAGPEFVLNAAHYGTGRQYLTLIGFIGGLPRSSERVLDILE